jgi:hypothetical protein
MPQATAEGVMLGNGEHGAAVAALLRKALADVDGVEFGDQHVGDLRNLSVRLSQEAEEARQAELLLDDAASALGLSGPINLLRARSILDAITLAAEAPEMGDGVPARLRPPGGMAAAKHAVKVIRSLQARRDELLSNVKLSGDLSLEAVRTHAKALDRRGILSFMSRATKAARRFYASIQQQPGRVSRKQMARVLGGLARFLEGKNELDREWSPGLGTLYDGVATDLELLEAVSRWAEKVGVAFAASQPDGTHIAEGFLASDGKALDALRRLSKNPRLSVLLGGLPWKQPSIRERVALLEAHRDAVNNLAAFLARSGVSNHTRLVRLPEIVRAIEAVASATTDGEPPQALNEAVGRTLDANQDSDGNEGSLAAISRLPASPLSHRCPDVVAAAPALGPERTIESAGDLIGVRDQQEKIQPAVESPEIPAPLLARGPGLDLADFRPMASTNLADPDDAESQATESVADAEVGSTANLDDVLRSSG